MKPITALLGTPRIPAAVCLVLAALTALPAAYDVWKIGDIVASQLMGPARGTDFLNLYTGAYLLGHQPWSLYDLEAQLAFQRSLTGWESPIVPFYLPPYAAVAVAWLGFLPYGAAYLAWLLLGIGCLAAAAVLIAPRKSGRRSAGVWMPAFLVYLPALLGVAQGQTAALTLLSFALMYGALASGAQPTLRAYGGLLGLTLKPQFAPLFGAALLVGRRWTALALVVATVALFALIGGVVTGPLGLRAYSQLSAQKWSEAFNADPQFLPGPTLLHASHRAFGVNATSQVVAIVLIAISLGCVASTWRSGLRPGPARLLQLAMVPLVAIIAAPYALVYELTVWMASFWLLWRYSEGRPGTRTIVLWLSAAIWLCSNVGVAAPSVGGSETAAVLGLLGVVFITVLFHRDAARDIGRPPDNPAGLCPRITAAGSAGKA